MIKKDENRDPLQEFMKNIDEITEQYVLDQEDTEQEEQIKNKVIQITKKLSILEQTTFDHALIGICALMQSGAYLKNVINRKIKLGKVEFTKKNLLFAADQVDNRYTLRIIAKFLRKIIATISNKYSIPGHLYARFKIENANLIAQSDPETVKQYAIYCTDFQIENPDTPPIIREYLANREKTRKYKI